MASQQWRTTERTTYRYTSTQQQPQQQQAYAAPAPEQAQWNERETMSKVREEVKILQQEYDSLLAELERKGQELVHLKSERTRKRRDALSETPAANMKNLVERLRSLQNSIAVNTDRALQLDDMLDETRMSQLKLASKKSENDDDVREMRENMDYEMTRNAQMKQQYAELEQEFKVREQNLNLIEQQQGFASQKLMAERKKAMLSDTHGQLADDLALLDGLKELLPQLDEEIAEAEMLLRERNETLRDRMSEREFLQAHLDSLAPMGGGTAYGGDPDANIAQLIIEVELIKEMILNVEEDVARTEEEKFGVLNESSAVDAEISAYKEKQGYLRQSLAERETLIRDRRAELEEQNSAWKRAEHVAKVNREKLGKADEIEQWRLRKLQKQIEIKKQIRDKERQEIAKIVEKARRIKAQEIAALRQKVSLEEADIKRRGDVESLLRDVEGDSAWAVPASVSSSSHKEVYTTTTTSRSYQARSSRGAVTESIRGGSRAELMQHSNPTVRAAARRVQGSQ